MSTDAPSSLLEQVRLTLLRGKTWRYLRYLHFLDYLRPIAPEIETVCVCGAGHGWAEVAAAIEFPHLRFTLTDIIAKGYPNYHQAMAFCWRHDIGNVQFSIWNVLQPAPHQFDLVCSTEMLEHIENAPRAAKNMQRAAKRYVYCLVPFATDEDNNDTAKRQRVWEQNEHYVCGYNPAMLDGLFSGVFKRAGTYWGNAGQPFRKRLQGMANDQILARYKQLGSDAEADLIDRVPRTISEAMGIKILCHVKQT